jgi:hypothetical protein
MTTSAPGQPARIFGAAAIRSSTPLRGSMRPTKPITGAPPSLGHGGSAGGGSSSIGQ